MITTPRDVRKFVINLPLGFLKVFSFTTKKNRIIWKFVNNNTSQNRISYILGSSTSSKNDTKLSAATTELISR